MRPILILGAFLCFIFSVIGQNLYDDAQVIKMEFIFEQENYWDLLVQNKEAQIDIPFTLVVNDAQTFYSVGVRFKGNSSYNMSNDKKPFNISMDAFFEDQHLWGYETFNLNNAFMDPTFMREKLTYDIFRKYMPAGKVGYVDLYINGVSWGLYVNVEQINKDFIRQWFADDEGNLYKGDPRGTMQWMGENADDYLQQFEKKTNEDENDWSDIIFFLDILHHSQKLQEELPQVLNIDRALWYMALCNILVNLDSYIYEGHNYYFYHDSKSDQFHIIPWDLNESFGCFPAGRLNAQAREKFPVFYGEDQFNMPLSQILFSVPEYRSIYMAHYASLLKNEFQVDTINTRIDALKSFIEPYVQNDPKKLYTYDLFLKNITNNVFINNNRIAPGLLKLTANRVNYLENYSELMIPNITVDSLTCSETCPVAGKTFTVTAHLSSGDPIAEVLFYYKINGQHFNSVAMIEENSGSLNQQYSCEIFIPENAAGYDLKCYVRVMNEASQMIFYPEQAEFEVLVFNISSDHEINSIVINEFMADNDNVIQDAQGEYNDWIELYNPTESAIHLNGYGLTDDLNEPMKWILPDITLDVDAYLIIWADSDDDSIGLHANFKLDKSGEAIALYDPQSQLVDAITYPSQTTDQSYGRLPNGSGNFTSLENCSPGAHNEAVTSIEKDLSNKKNFILLDNYPNPFNPMTVIGYQLSVISDVQLDIYNASGQHVRNLISGEQSAGSHQIQFDGSGLPSGIYIYQLETNDFLEKKKMLLLK